MSKTLNDFIDEHFAELENIYSEFIGNAIVLDRKEFIVASRPIYNRTLELIREMKKLDDEELKEKLISKTRELVDDALPIFISRFHESKIPVKYLRLFYKRVKRSKFKNINISKAQAYEFLISLSDEKTASELTVEEQTIIKGACLNVFTLNELFQIAQATRYFSELDEESLQIFDAMGIENQYLIFSQNSQKAVSTFLTYKGSFRSILKNMLTPEMVIAMNNHKDCPKSLKFEEGQTSDYVEKLREDMDYKLKSILYIQHILDTGFFGKDELVSKEEIAGRFNITVQSLENNFVSIRKTLKY